MILLLLLYIILYGCIILLYMIRYICLYKSIYIFVKEIIINLLSSLSIGYLLYLHIYISDSRCLMTDARNF